MQAHKTAQSETEDTSCGDEFYLQGDVKDIDYCIGVVLKDANDSFLPARQNKDTAARDCFL